jgi:hypothetical protein
MEGRSCTESNGTCEQTVRSPTTGNTPVSNKFSLKKENDHDKGVRFLNVMFLG